MKNLITLFKKQNLEIKIGFVALAISIIYAILGLILIATANFKPDPNQTKTMLEYQGNGFNVIYMNGGIGNFLTKSGYNNILSLYSNTKYLTYPIAQIIVGIVFGVILTGITGGIAALALIFGYFKRWLYS